MLRQMNGPFVVKIIGAPIACQDGVKDTWREVAAWAAVKLKASFNDRIRVDYYDLFDPTCPALLPNAQLPVVMIDDNVISCGGKISVPLIRKKIEELDKAFHLG